MYGTPAADAPGAGPRPPIALSRIPRPSLRRVGDVTLFLFWAAQSASAGRRASQAGTNQDWLACFHFAIVAIVVGVSAVLFLLRGPAVARGTGLAPKLIAFAGTWAIIPLTMLPLTWRPGWLLVTSTGGLVIAYLFVLWALLTLRRNLSIFPEARQLVRHGPYALVRHPLYSAHIISYTLIALPRLGWAALLIAAAGIGGELLRARNEERVLRGAFPEYASYAATTPRFVPRVMSTPTAMASHGGNPLRISTEESS